LQLLQNEVTSALPEVTSIIVIHMQLPIQQYQIYNKYNVRNITNRQLKLASKNMTGSYTLQCTQPRPLDALMDRLAPSYLADVYISRFIRHVAAAVGRQWDTHDAAYTIQGLRLVGKTLPDGPGDMEQPPYQTTDFISVYQDIRKKTRFISSAANTSENRLIGTMYSFIHLSAVTVGFSVLLEC